MLASQERYSAMVVASAAPATPMPSTATKATSSTILVRQEISSNSKVDRLSPSPRRIPAFML